MHFTQWFAEMIAQKKNTRLSAAIQRTDDDDDGDHDDEHDDNVGRDLDL